jgi:hypothetical protein
MAVNDSIEWQCRHGLSSPPSGRARTKALNTVLAGVSTWVRRVAHASGLAARDLILESPGAHWGRDYFRAPRAHCELACR